MSPGGPVDRELSGKVVAITGGARGIGLATAEALARRGARVALGDLDGDEAADRATALGALGLPLDVTDEHSFAGFLDHIHDRLGPPDALVNNAGVAVLGEFLDTSARDHARQVAVNVGGVLRGMRLALPAMVGRGTGHIVNIASAGGRIPTPTAAVYSGTKHAVVGLTEAVRAELRGTGVRLTAVLPTVVDTGMAAGVRVRGVPRVSAAAVGEAIVRVLTRRHPPGQVTVPRWFAGVALLDAVAPDWLRDRARRFFVLDRSG